MIKLQAKIFELNFLSKFSDLKSNFTLTLGYLNPPLNNRGQDYKRNPFAKQIKKIQRKNIATLLNSENGGRGSQSSSSTWRQLELPSRAQLFEGQLALTQG